VAEAEVCDECAFHGERWTDGDLLTTLPVIAALWEEYLDGLDPDLTLVRAEAGQWSIAEYTDHVREVLFGMRFLVGVARTEPESDLGPSPEPVVDAEPRAVQLARAIERVHDEGGRLAAELVALEPNLWAAGVVVDGQRVDVRWIARHAVHDSLHHLHDIGRIRARLGGGTPRGSGTIVGVHRSEGGLPKAAVDAADVDWDGVVGDRQLDRRHHGRPFQALCLWSSDLIAALVEEGHPIRAGAAGENLTIEGVDWATLRPGAVVRVGTVMAEISSYATPCAKNAHWFDGRRFDRIDQAEHPGWSRLYARVLRPGRVQVGDGVDVEPDGTP
jgi:MOSC domain-containing protein YiiM